MDFKDSNQKTIRAYEDHTQKFASSTSSMTSGIPKEWIDSALKLIPRTGSILELGSGTGRDASYIKQRGYNIVCSDIVKGFLEILGSRDLHSQKIDVRVDPFGGPYDMILANCVFLHLNKKELHSVLSKSHEALQEKGILACSFMEGNGPAWLTHRADVKRFFQLWQPEEIMAILRAHGFTARYMRYGDSGSTVDKFYLIAAKTQ